MRVLYLDCFSGISGDMMVGALCDLGVKPSMLEWELTKVEIGDFHMHFERQSRQHVEGVKFGIHEGATHRPEGDEEHGTRSRMNMATNANTKHTRMVKKVITIITRRRILIHTTSIPPMCMAGPILKFVRSLKVYAFRFCEETFSRHLPADRRRRGKIHGILAADVQFYEVGALDSIADIICACVGIEHMG